MESFTLTDRQARIITPGHPYVRGETHPNTLPVARFEFKRPSPGHTGGGYPRWRSVEWCEHTSRRSSQDVFVPVHRLSAVAWCYGDGWGVSEILTDMDGKDVHHELGLPSATVESELSVIDHGEHSSVTQAERRAWARDEQRAREQGGWGDDGCPECGAEVQNGGATVGATSGLCLSCATAEAKATDAQIEL